MFQLNLKTSESCQNPVPLNAYLDSSRNYDIPSQPQIQSSTMRYKRFTQSTTQALQPFFSSPQQIESSIKDLSSFDNLLPRRKQKGRVLFNAHAGISITKNLKKHNEDNQIREKIQKNVSLNLSRQTKSNGQLKSINPGSPGTKTKSNGEKQNSDVPKIDKKSLLEKQSMKAQELKDGKQTKPRNYYNKWYIPADKRFFPQIQEDQSIQDQILKQQNEYKQDPHLIYNQLKDSKIKYFNDPFDLVPSEEAMQLLSVKNKLNKFKDQFRNSKLLIKYIDQLQLSKERIPQFLQNVQFTFK